MARVSLEDDLGAVLRQYADSFSSKTYSEENDDFDVLMEIFGITPQLKRENRQYWGRELGMCWQLLVSRVFQSTRRDYAPGLRSGADEICDCMIGKRAIDTKYRIGSGDSGTLKKFKQYGRYLTNNGLEPILLILRQDNLPAAMQACKLGGWQILLGEQAFSFVKEYSRFDLFDFLRKAARKYHIKRTPRTP